MRRVSSSDIHDHPVHVVREVGLVPKEPAKLECDVDQPRQQRSGLGRAGVHGSRPAAAPTGPAWRGTRPDLPKPSFRKTAADATLSSATDDSTTVIRSRS